MRKIFRAGFLLTAIIVFINATQARSQTYNDCRKNLARELVKKSDTVYFRKQKEFVRLGILTLQQNTYKLKAVSPRGNSYEIKATVGKFNPSEHKIKTSDSCDTRIDGQFAYGTDGGLPATEIKTLEVNINGRTISIPKSAYKNLYEPHIEHLRMPVTANETTDGKQLNLYIFGSDGAGAYMAKLVFSKTAYLTTIAFQSDYGFTCEF